MTTDLSTLRRLERIEKEIGYCEIKLEKEQRLVAQLRFLRMHGRHLADAVRAFRTRHPELDAMAADGTTLEEIGRACAARSGSATVKALRERFRCAGALPILEEELDVLRQEAQELHDRLSTFESFRIKKRRLLDERDRTLDSLEPADPACLAEMSAEFERSEQTWNTLTEDLINVDEAIFFVRRASDYLGSARGFVLTSRGQPTVDGWLRTGYLIDLFKHSTIGRAKEMVEGTERNLKRALMQLVCLEEVRIRPEDFAPLLLPFLDALFDDLFRAQKLVATLALLDARIRALARLGRELDELHDRIYATQHVEEQNRVRLFNRIGDERKRLTLAESE